MTTCPLCQNQFEGDAACRSCGLLGDCSLLRCPVCGYEFVESSRILSFFRRLKPRPKSQGEPPGKTVTLVHTVPGVVYKIHSVAVKDQGTRSRLAVLGILPGGEIRILQKKPSYVARVGETDVALDRDLAEGIAVESRGS